MLCWREHESLSLKNNVDYNSSHTHHFCHANSRDSYLLTKCHIETLSIHQQMIFFSTMQKQTHPSDTHSPFQSDTRSTHRPHNIFRQTIANSADTPLAFPGTEVTFLDARLTIQITKPPSRVCLAGFHRSPFPRQCWVLGTVDVGGACRGLGASRALAEHVGSCSFPLACCDVFWSHTRCRHRGCPVARGADT